MNYENLSPVLAMMAVQLGQPSQFQKILQEARIRLNKKTTLTNKNRLK